jgi:hypothetical protein
VKSESAGGKKHGSKTRKREKCMRSNIFPLSTTEKRRRRGDDPLLMMMMMMRHAYIYVVLCVCSLSHLITRGTEASTNEPVREKGS